MATQDADNYLFQREHTLDDLVFLDGTQKGKKNDKKNKGKGKSSNKKEAGDGNKDGDKKDYFTDKTCYFVAKQVTV